MTTFNPTHRTNRAIGTIKAGSPIRVARYDQEGCFSNLLRQLGVTSCNIDYRYLGDDVQFWDPRDLNRTSRYVLLEDYVITDGEHFEVSGTDSGWDLLTKQQPEGVSLSSWGSDLYTLRGDAGGEIRLAASQLYELIQVIQNRVPKPSPIEDARFISARTVDSGEYRTLAKIDGAWYDHNGDAYTDRALLANYDEIGVIK